METIAESEYECGTIHFNNFQNYSAIEEESEEEDDKQRKLDLRRQLQEEVNFSTSESDDSSSDEDHNTNYSEYRSSLNRESVNYKESGNPHPASNEISDSVSLFHNTEDRAPISENHYTSESVWSADDDNSSNFIADACENKSPALFHLNMNEVLSSPDDLPTTDKFSKTYNGKYKTNDVHHHKFSNELIDENEDFLSHNAQPDRLQILYEARGRELDRISKELTEMKSTYIKRINELKRDFKDAHCEKERLLCSNSQMNILLTENEEKIRSLKSDLQVKENKLSELESSNKILKEKVDIDDGLINSLQLQVSELQSTDIVSRSRQAHEDFINKLNNSHRDEARNLRTKLQLAVNHSENLEAQIRTLESNLKSMNLQNETTLQERNRDTQKLKEDLEIARKQIDTLLKRNSVEDFQPSKEFNHNELQIVSNKLTNCEKELAHFHMLLKLGLFSSVVSQKPDDSFRQLTAAKVLTYEDTESATDSPRDAVNDTIENRNINEKLKEELIKSLYGNKKLKEEIKNLSIQISDKDNELTSLRKEFSLLKGDAKLQEVMDLPDRLKVIDENTSLKEDVVTLLRFYGNCKEKIGYITEKFTTLFKESNALSSDPALLSLLKRINECLAILKQSNDNQLERWNKAHQDNLQINSKILHWKDCLDEMMKNLNKFQDDFSAQSSTLNSDSSFLSALKNLMKSCLNATNEMKNELMKEFINSSKYHNELITIKMDCQRLETEKLDLQCSLKVAEEKVVFIKQESETELENWKEKYSKFYEQSLTSSRKELQANFDASLCSLKQELTNTRQRLVEAQNDYVVLSKEKNQFEKLYQESANKELAMTVSNKYQGKDEEMRIDLNNRNSSSDIQSRIAGINGIPQQTDSSKRFCIMKDAETNTEGIPSFVETNETFEKEKHRKLLTNQAVQTSIEGISTVDGLRENIAKKEEELRHLMNILTCLKNEILTSKMMHETEINKLRAEREVLVGQLNETTIKLEASLRDLGEHEGEVHQLSKVVHELQLQNASVKQSELALKNSIEFKEEKYKKYKQKICKVKHSLPQWQNEVRCKLRTQKRQSVQIVINIRNWLLTTRDALTEALNEVIEKLKAHSEKARLMQVMEPHLNALISIKADMLKLHLNEEWYNAFTQE